MLGPFNIESLIAKFSKTNSYKLEKEMTTHFGTLAWKIPWTEEPGRLQSMESQRVGHLRTCQTNQWGEELDGGGLHGRKEDGPKIGTKGLSGVLEMFCILLCVMVTFVYSLVKTHQTRCQRCMHFILCSLHLN